VRLAEDGKGNTSLGRLLVGNIKTLSSFKYEIYESSKPIRGVEIRNSGKSSGFLFLKYGGSNENPSYVSQLPKNRTLSESRIGIDFGSNNSCVAFKDEFNPAEILQFKNRRISFFTTDSQQNESNAIRPADTFEMLFFQNDETMSNKIKSVLTIHEETRLIDDKNLGNISMLYEEIAKGGFNCYETNIAIEDSTPNRHILSLQKIPDQKVQIVYNMKWNNDAREVSHKVAFLKALLLQTYAELFMRKEGPLFPKTVAWAYPAAMSKTRIIDYSTKVWSKVKDCNPLANHNFNLEVLSGSSIVRNGQTSLEGQAFGGGMTGGGMTGGGMTGGTMTSGGMTSGMGTSLMGGSQQMASILRELELPDEIQVMLNPAHQPSLIGNPEVINPNRAMTESQAVACFASGETPQAGHFVLGYDVGGSTTDLLAVTGISHPQIGRASALVKQNSIKLAAGILADATKSVPGFNIFLKDYASRKIGKIYGIDSMTPNTTPFFFNTILDRLDKKDELDDFYRNIAANSKPLMWLNLYVTGLNLFYGGMVARKLREHTERNQNLFAYTPLNSIKIDFYGKGSRIFDWYKALDAQNAMSYYAQCFAKGFGENEANSLFSIGSTFRLGNFEDLGAPLNVDNVKTEVAKGLTMADSVFEFNTQMNEISGEDGYMLRVPGQQKPIPLNALMDINPSLIQRLGSELLPPQPGPNAYPRFVSFMNTFFDFASQTLDFKADGQEVMRAITSMNILNDLRNDEDYKEALKNGKEFDFVAPLIILQGQAFLRSYLLPKIQRG
jgi:hypothetical protein